MKRALTILLLCGACGTEGDSRVRFDLAELWQQGAQSVSTIDLWVYGSTGQVSYYQQLTDMDATPVIEIVAAADLRFEIRALAANHAPSYWGEVVQTIAPGEDIVDVTIPVFPAGGIAGTVTVSDSTPIPVGTVVIAAADTPRTDPDAINDRELDIIDSSFTGTVLDGLTNLTVSFLDVGASYTGTTQVTVVQGQIVGDITLDVAPQ